MPTGWRSEYLEVISKVVPKIWARTNSAIVNYCSLFAFLKDFKQKEGVRVPVVVRWARGDAGLPGQKGMAGEPGEGGEGKSVTRTRNLVGNRTGLSGFAKKKIEIWFRTGDGKTIISMKRGLRSLPGVCKRRTSENAKKVRCWGFLGSLVVP